MLDRTAFEEQVLKEALLDPGETMIGGEMFRGDNYTFALIEKETRKPCYYDQSLFAMFDIEDYEAEWRLLDDSNRQELLRDWKVDGADAEEILLRHEVFPFWGVLRGTLRPKYQRVEYCREKEDCLTVVTDQPYVFYQK